MIACDRLLSDSKATLRLALLYLSLIRDRRKNPQLCHCHA